MYTKHFALGVLGVAIAASGCATHVFVNAKAPKLDAVTQPSLGSVMKTPGSPTIVLRVPAPQAQVTQAQSQQGNVAINQSYNLIEKELVKAGFTVRDRGLLEEVLRSNQNLDYRVIRDKIDAKLILEIVSISPRSYDNDEYTTAKDRQPGRLVSGAFPIAGWQFQCKVIIVDTGEIGGLYTIDVAPGDNPFLIKGDNITNATAGGLEDPAHFGYGIPLETAAEPFVRMLLSYLKSGAAEAGPLVVVGVPTSPVTDTAPEAGGVSPRR